MPTVLDIFLSTQALIAAPESFCQGAPARRANGDSCSAHDPLATQWDIEGALYCAAGRMGVLGLPVAETFAKVVGRWPSLIGQYEAAQTALAHVVAVLRQEQALTHAPEVRS